jgi:hypothetical protein
MDNVETVQQRACSCLEIIGAAGVATLEGLLKVIILPL